MKINPILDTDSYKVSHWVQYPPGTTEVYSYFESRGGPTDSTVFFGLQYMLREWLSVRITKEMVDEAEPILTGHMGQFNRAGWDHIVHDHQGKWPVSIWAVPEGTSVPVKNVLFTIQNTCQECFWVTNYLETALVRVWYPTTVATISRNIKKTIKTYLDITGDIAGLPFKLHDFGCRGVSSQESAAIGGAAHLVNFLGTDTVPAMQLLKEHYGAVGSPGFSIPASEHSTITAWGKDRELDAFKNMLLKYPTGLVACVSDSYSITNAVRNLWGNGLRMEVSKRNGTLVVRPDSGDPVRTTELVIKELDSAFGSQVNAKGYKVLHPSVRIIQGDGVDHNTIEAILDNFRHLGYSADNIAFGMGGALLQRLDRDTFKFAMKCSNVVVHGKDVPVWKQPEGAPWKASKKGKLILVDTNVNGLTTISSTNDQYLPYKRFDLLQEVYRSGDVKKFYTLETVRQRAYSSV